MYPAAKLKYSQNRPASGQMYFVTIICIVTLVGAGGLKAINKILDYTTDVQKAFWLYSKDTGVENNDQCINENILLNYYTVVGNPTT